MSKLQLLLLSNFTDSALTDRWKFNHMSDVTRQLGGLNYHKLIVHSDLCMLYKLLHQAGPSIEYHVSSLQ